MNSSGEAASGGFAVGLLVGGKYSGTSHLNLVLLSFLAVNGDCESRDRVWQRKYLWKRQGSINVIEQVMGEASSAKCGSRYVHSVKWFQTGTNMKKGAEVMQEVIVYFGRRLKGLRRLFGLVNMSGHKCQKVVSAKAYCWH